MNNNKLILSIVAIAVLLVVVVGATFAYFASTYTQSGSNQNVSVTTKTVTAVTYKTGSAISFSNLNLPSGTKNTYVKAAQGTFDITAGGSSATDTVTYDIKITVSTNTIKTATQQGATGNVMCRLFSGATSATVTTQVGSDIDCDETVVLVTDDSFTTAGTPTASGGKYYRLEVYVWNANTVDNTIGGKSYAATLSVINLNTATNPTP